MATPNTTAATPNTTTHNAAPRPQPRPHRTVHKQYGNSAGLIAGVVVASLLALAVGVYAWLHVSEQKNETAALRSKVSFLETRMENTEGAIVQITAGEDILPATRSDDGNLIINPRERSADPRVQKTQSQKKQAATTAKRTARNADRRTRAQTAPAGYAYADGYTYSDGYAHSGGYTRSDDGRAPATFGDTYTPPTSVHYAVLIDSFGERRQAEITKSLFVMRYGTYIRQVGTRFNVYAGWYKDVNDARTQQRSLEAEYGPSCRVVTLYQ